MVTKAKKRPAIRAPIDKVPVTGQWRVQVVRGDRFIAKRLFNKKSEATAWSKKAKSFYKDYY